MIRTIYAPLVAAALLSAGAATAAPTVYTSAAAFSSATTGVTTNGFNAAPVNGSTYLFPNNATTWTQPGFSISQGTRNAFNSNGDTNPSTFYYYNWGTGGVIHSPYEGTMTITFDTAVTAFALDLGVFYGMAFPYPPNTIPGAATTLYGQQVRIGTAQGNFTVDTATTRNLSFFGLTSDTAFTSFTITGLSGQGGASTVFDNLRFGSVAAQAVPEPATWAMMMLGFGFVGASLRRRQSQVRVTYA